MSYQGKLNSYIERVQQRLRLGASVRGAAMLTAAALITTVVLVVILNAFGFPKHGLPGARAALIALLAVTALVGLALPLLRLNRTRSIETAETAHPEFKQRLVTFHEKEAAGNDPFIELLATDTLSIAEEDAPSERLVPQKTLYAFAGAGAGVRGCAGVDDCGWAGVSGVRRFAAVDGAEARCCSAVRDSGVAGGCCGAAEQRPVDYGAGDWAEDG